MNLTFIDAQNSNAVRMTVTEDGKIAVAGAVDGQAVAQFTANGIVLLDWFADIINRRLQPSNIVPTCNSAVLAGANNEGGGNIPGQTITINTVPGRTPLVCVACPAGSNFYWNRFVDVTDPEFPVRYERVDGAQAAFSYSAYDGYFVIQNQLPPPPYEPGYNDPQSGTPYWGGTADSITVYYVWL